ncbi:MAG: zinc ribbon domain-containing protein [Lachnospiraceae bacterium]|jgi:ribosomal protein L40E|nr:zinc ribbon domain-containing protein [Lachnospiraceae bacterium]MCI9307212.1 zinc ribbon domain-containing protein [Lachnospiraceae bacterium]
MDIFNKAKESLSAAGKGFTQKASDVSGLAKVTMKIKEEEKQLDQSLKELGTLLFNQYNEESKQLFPQQSENIRQLYAALQQDREELAYLKGKKICPNCGAELDGDVQRCTSCGMNVENVVRPSRIQAYCQSCGAQLTPGSRFCNNCGAKIE